MEKSNGITIIQDTREQQPWKFISDNRCTAQIVACLSEGDYTLVDYPNLVCIERKKSVSEIANNLGTNYTRFKNELERLRKYRFRYVVCEFTEEQLLIYPKGSKLPKWVIRRIKMGGKFLHHRIKELIEEYQIEFVFCEDKIEAKHTAMELLLKAKKVYDDEIIIMGSKGGGVE
jgi:hypothetical protein